MNDLISKKNQVTHLLLVFNLIQSEAIYMKVIGHVKRYDMLNKIKGNIYECYGLFANLIWLESNSFPNSPYSVLLILRIHAPEDQGGIMINHVLTMLPVDMICLGFLATLGFVYKFHANLLTQTRPGTLVSHIHS